MLFKKNEIVDKHYDVIVIGAGLGGMTAANTLAKAGKKVLLLEAHNKLGGFATWFYRKNVHNFDVSLHGFPYGMVKTCRKYWSQEVANQIVKIPKVRFINPQFDLSTDFTQEDFVKHLQTTFQAPAAQIELFFKHLNSINFYDDVKHTIYDLFETYFPNRNDIHRFLLEPITYANGSSLQDPSLTYAIVFGNFIKKGVYTFSGSTDQLVRQLKNILLENGVDIKLQTKVDQILIENQKVIGIKSKNAVIKANAVLSNANILTTVKDLIGPDHFSEAYLQEFKSVRANSSSCQVYLGLKEDVTLNEDLYGELIFHSDAETYSHQDLMSFMPSSRTFSLYGNRHRKAGERHAIVSSTNALFKDWINLNAEEYEKAKNDLIQNTLTALQKVMPEMVDKIDFIQAATPLTIKKFTHHPEGTSFGTKFEGLNISQNLPQQIKGAFHGGSVGIIMSGWLGAANYGVIVSNEIDTYLQHA